MLLEELRNHGAEELNYRIFATDLNAQQIAKAQRGQYSADEVKNLTVRRLGNWLVRQDDSYHIVPVLRDRIEFSVFDLFDQSLSSPPGSIFGDFDLILCANVLMYYNEESRSAILKKSESSLTDGGLFVTDEAERGLMVAHGWREVYQQTAIFRSDR
jgi:chemotaxis methyl-accepting protein methylase